MRKIITILALGALTGALHGQALPFIPQPYAAYISPSGTGATGSWNPLTGTGGMIAIPYIPAPIGIYYSNDGSGAAGTWVPWTGAGGGGGSGTVTHTAGALTSGQMVIGNGSGDIKVDTGCSTDGAGNQTCASYATSGTLQGFEAYGAGTGTISATLPTNFVGWIGPASGTPAYFLQLPSANPTAGQLLTFAAPTTVNGVSQAVGTWTSVTKTIASGTSALGTSAIASGACATAVTTTATGVASTDAITWNPNGSIKAVTGYVPATAGGLSIAAYPTSGNVNFDVCNWTAGSITPGAVTINWRVVR